MSTEKNYAVDPESIIAHATPEDETNDQEECDSEKTKKSFLGKLLCCCGTLKLRKALASASYSTNQQTSEDGRRNKRIEKNEETGTDPTYQSSRFFEGAGYTFLPRASPNKENLVCLVVDLDETLVHSSFKHRLDADFVVPVEIENQVHQVYVKKRPYVDEFLKVICPLFECVLFTASLSKYADPVVDLLDHCHCFQFRLFRTSCTLLRGTYVKDLGRLGRKLNRVAILDNSPSSYQQHVENAIPIKSWFGDPSDDELLKLIEPLRDLAACRSIFDILPNLVPSLSQGAFSMNNNIAGTSSASSLPVAASPVKIILGEISLFSMGNDFRLLLDSTATPTTPASCSNNSSGAAVDTCLRKGRRQDSAKRDSPFSVSSNKTSNLQMRSSHQHETSFTSKHSTSSSASSNARSAGRTRSHHSRSNRERSRRDPDDGKRSASLLLDASNLSDGASSSARPTKSSKSFETIVVPAQRRSTRTSSASLASTKLEFINSGSIFSPTPTGNVSSIF